MKSYWLTIVLLLEIFVSRAEPLQWNSILTSEVVLEFPSCSASELGKHCNNYPNATCKNNELCRELGCKCSSGFVPFINSSGKLECLPLAWQMGAQCTINEQCTAELTHAECTKEGTCSCIPGTYHSEMLGKWRCDYHKNIGEQCESDGDCSAATIDASCDYVNKICTCPKYTYHNQAAKSCFPVPVLIGEPCEDNGEQCVAIQNAYCAGHTGCQCKTNHIPLLDRNEDWERVHKCLLVQTSLHGECMVSAQCNDTITNSDCFENQKGKSTCQCISGYVESQLTPNRCLPIHHEFHDSCEEDIQCISGNFSGEVECTAEHKCHCKPGSTPGPWSNWGSSCKAMVPLGQACSEDVVCVDASGSSYVTICDNATKLCTCNFAVAQDGVCIWEKYIGYSCKSSKECRSGISGGVVCETGVCACDFGYRPNSAKDSCIQVHLPTDEECTEHWQCQSADCMESGVCAPNEGADKDFWTDYGIFIVYGGLALVSVLMIALVVFSVIRLLRHHRPWLFGGSRRNTTLFGEDLDEPQNAIEANNFEVSEKF